MSGLQELRSSFIESVYRMHSITDDFAYKEREAAKAAIAEEAKCYVVESLIDPKLREAVAIALSWAASVTKK